MKIHELSEFYGHQDIIENLKINGYLISKYVETVIQSGCCYHLLPGNIAIIFFYTLFIVVIQYHDRKYVFHIVPQHRCWRYGLIGGVTLLQEKNSTGRRWDSNPGPCRQHDHCCKSTRPLRHLDSTLLSTCINSKHTSYL